MAYRKTSYSYGSNNGNSSPSFDCQFCDRRFRSRVDQCLHKMNAHGAFYLCSFCDKQFHKQYETIEHVKKDHNARNRFWCIYCWRLFEDQSFLRAHQNYAHRSNDMHFCPRCQKLAPNRVCLEIHLEYEDGYRRTGTASCHSDDNRRCLSKTDHAKVFCLQCFKRCPIDDLDQHARDHLINSQYLACNECFAVIKNVHDLKSHKSCLIAESLRLNDRLAIICRKCDFRSRDDAQFDRHYNWCHSMQSSMHVVANEIRPLATCLKDTPKIQALAVSSETLPLSINHYSASPRRKIDEPIIDDNRCPRKPLLPEPSIVADQIDRDVKAPAVDLMRNENFTMESDNKSIPSREIEIIHESSNRDIDNQKPIKRKSSDGNGFPIQTDQSNQNRLNKKIKFEDSSTSSSDGDEENDSFGATKNTSSSFLAGNVGEISKLINNVGAQNASLPIRANLLRKKDDMAQNLLRNLKNKEKRNAQSQPKVVARYHCTLCPVQPTVYLHSIKRHLTHVHKVCMGDEHKFYEKRDGPLTEKVDVATQAKLISLQNRSQCCRTCLEKEAKIRKLSDLMKILVTAASQVQQAGLIKV